MRESRIEAHLVKCVTLTGGITRKAQWIQRKGCPDRWCGWPTTKRTGWVELKGDGGRLSGHQEREIPRLRACGERVDVIATLEQVEEYVAEMAKINIGQLRAAL